MSVERCGTAGCDEKAKALRTGPLPLRLFISSGGWPIFALRHSHGGCPILAFFARVSGDAAGAVFVRSIQPVVDAVVVPALRKVRKGRGPRSCGGFCSLKAG